MATLSPAQASEPPYPLAGHRQPAPADQPEHRRRSQARQPQLHPGDRAPGGHHRAGSPRRPAPRRGPRQQRRPAAAHPVRDQRPHRHPLFRRVQIRGPSCSWKMMAQTEYRLRRGTLLPTSSCPVHGTPLVPLGRTPWPSSRGAGSPRPARNSSAAILVPAWRCRRDVFNLVPYPGGPPADVDTYIKPSLVPGCFASGLPAKKAEVIAVTQRPLAASTLSESSGTPAWKDRPVMGCDRNRRQGHPAPFAGVGLLGAKCRPVGRGRSTRPAAAGDAVNRAWRDVPAARVGAARTG